jgi:hypothetical protein
MDIEIRLFSFISMLSLLPQESRHQSYSTERNRYPDTLFHYWLTPALSHNHSIRTHFLAIMRKVGNFIDGGKELKICGKNSDASYEAKRKKEAESGEIKSLNGDEK